MENVKKVTLNLKNQFPEIFNDEPNFSLEILPSKQNLVYNLKFDSNPKRSSEEIIVKVFKSDKAKNEYDTIKKLEKQKLLVPKVVKFKSPVLLLEKVKGDNLCDYVNDTLLDKKQLDDLESNIRDKLVDVIKLVATWIANLHKKNIVERKKSEITTLNKGDVRLRDFIIDLSQNLLVGVDFENSYEGNHHDDLAWICCSLIDTNPGLFEMSEPTHKIELINILLNEYYRKNTNFKFSFKYFAAQLIENLNTVIKRRHLDYSLRKSSILKKLITDV